MAYHVLFVPGSWHVPAHFERLVTELRTRGVSSTVVSLPTCNLSNAHIEDLDHPDLAGPRPQTPWPNMYADAAAVRAEITRLVDAGNMVIVSPHSYGGVPASEALVSELTRTSRARDGMPGGVVGMFAMCSFFLPPGITTMMAVGGKPLPMTPEQPSGLHICLNPAENLVNDLSPEEQKHWVSLMRPQSYSVHETPATNAGFLNVPCGYLKTLNDIITPVAVQEGGIAASRGFGANIVEYSVSASHDAFIGHPKECADSLVDFADRCVQAV